MKVHLLLLKYLGEDLYLFKYDVKVSTRFFFLFYCQEQDVFFTL